MMNDVNLSQEYSQQAIYMMSFVSSEINGVNRNNPSGREGISGQPAAAYETYDKNQPVQCLTQSQELTNPGAKSTRIYASM